ncbi:MAG: hypothetical protein LBH43_07985 [Treponema sp.]|jgi:nucleoid-associated protein YgaU|nr:hypothetical protein [Treponema sp.]
MDNKRTHHQAPQPEVKIYDPDDGPDGTPKLIFDLSHRTTLQSYTFSTAVNDAKGEFSLTFYPDDDKAVYEDEKGVDGREAIFDRIQMMDIVEIYETKNNFIEIPHSEMGITSRNITVRKLTPSFTGVIRSKKYVVQMTDGGPRRSILVSGHSIAGLVQEFRMSLDMQTMELTKQTANNAQLSIELTEALIWKNEKEEAIPIPVKVIVEKIWEKFLEISNQFDKLTNCKVSDYITKWMGEGIFDFDDSEFYYPIANVFFGQKSESFYNIIEGIVPQPVYEIFPYVKNGVTKIKIRIAPFDIKDVWNGNEMEKAKKQIDPVMVKSFDIQQSDNEVYTVYFAYIHGSPIDMDKAIILSSQNVKGIQGVAVDEGKFGKYGYRPLFISLRGYGKSQKDDVTTAENRLKLSNRLKEWFCNLDEMYTGKITMSTNITGKKEYALGKESVEMPQPGEKISFLGGEFYVTAAQHSWNYGGNPETTLSISRGGDYSEEEEREETDTLKKERQPVTHTVVSLDTLRDIMIANGGNGTEWRRIVELNHKLQERERIGDVVQIDGSPKIYPGDSLVIPWLGPDEYETVTKKVKKVKFNELKNITKRYQEFKGVVEEWTL